MENQYGITVTNKYDLFLNEDEDPLDILRQQEEALLKKKEDKAKKDTKNEKTKSAGKSKKDKKVTPAAETKTKVLDQNANRKEAAPQKGFGAVRQMSDNKPMDKRPLKEGNRDLPPRRERGDRPDRPPSSDFRDRGEGGERGRGRGRGGDRRGRGGRGRGGGGPGFDRFGKREFERHSGSDRTGIKPVDKKDGGGAHNWGTINDDLEEQLNDTQTSEDNPEWAAQTEEVENQDPNDSAVDAEATDAAPEEEPVREMTLDEYKAQQQQAKLQTQFNLRRAGEGVDDSQWKKTYVYKKPTQDSDESEEESEEEEDSEDESANKRVNIEITFYDNPRRGVRGGRRGRGQGRGRGDFMGGGRGRGEGVGDGERGGGRGRGFGQPRGRGEGRGRGGERGSGGGGGGRGGGQRKEVVPNTEDESEFPSLGK